MEREDSSDEDENFEEIGGIGLIRACVRNEDGSSNLVLQGLCRVRFVGEVERLPYRSCGIEPMPAECLDPAGAKRWLKRLRNSGNQLADKQPDLFKAIGNVATMDASPEIIAEIAAAALPLGRPLSFKLLAEPVVEKRLEWLARIAEALLENIDDS